MAGLLSSLDASVQALNAQSYAIQISGKNVANLNNESYSEESVEFGGSSDVATPEGVMSTGITIQGVTQNRNALLDAQVAREASLTSSLQTQQQFLQEAQTGLGENITNTSSSSSTSGADAGSSGLSASLDNFFNSFQSFAAAPTDTGQQQSLLQNAATLTSGFQQTDSNLAQVQSDLTNQIQSKVTDANQQLQTIASLNSQIASLEVGHPGSAVDLRDQREAAIEALAADVPITTTTGANGMVNVSMTDASNNPVALVSGSAVTGPLAFSGSTLTGGASATALQISSGSIYGAQSVRDGAVQTMRDNLDSLASQIVTSVNAAYNPTAAPGGDFFNPAGTTAGTIALSGSLSASTLVAGAGAAGDNSIALAVAGIANQTFSTGSGDAIDGTISQYYSGAVSSLGQTLLTTTNLLQTQTAVQSLVTTQRDNVSGVSLDAEMGNLMKYQSAYQASARVMSTIDSLLSTLINNTGQP